MIDLALAIVALAATLISTIGETRNKSQSGLKSLTSLGRVALILSVSVFLLTSMKIYASVQEESKKETERIAARRTAHLEVSKAIDRLAFVMPYVDQFGDVSGNTDVSMANQARYKSWTNSTRASEYAHEVSENKERLQRAIQTNVQSLSSQSLAETQKLLNESLLSVFVIPRNQQDTTLAQQFFSIDDLNGFRDRAAIASCKLLNDLTLFEYETVPITRKIFEEKIRPKRVLNSKIDPFTKQPSNKMVLEDFRAAYKFSHAITRNGHVLHFCNTEGCKELERQRSDRTNCFRAAEDEG